MKSEHELQDLGQVPVHRSLLRWAGIGAMALLCAVVLGAGVPLGWVWLASQVQPSPGQGVSGFAALLAMVGPIVTYALVLLLAGRLSARGDNSRRYRPIAWSRSSDEARRERRATTTFEQVVILTTLLVAAGFEIYFILFAHQTPWGSG